MTKHHVSTTINGEPVEFLCEPQQTLLDVLRDELQPDRQQGRLQLGRLRRLHASSVDGQIVCSCLMLGAEAEGRKITTIEGIAEGDKLHPVQQKFLEHAALQCGFCTPGFIVAAKALLDENPNPTEEETRYWLAGNLCRCTGYDKIIRAVLDAAAVMRAEARAMSYLDKDDAEGRRHPADPPGRRRQGHRPRQFRRRHDNARHAVGQDQAQPARACPDHVDQHRQGDGAARRQGGRRRAPISRTSRRTSASIGAGAA